MTAQPGAHVFDFMSICSGIEAASVALTPLGFESVLLSEIEDQQCALLKYRWRGFDVRSGRAPKPWVPLWGDFSALRVRHMDRLGIAMPDLLIGGTPCQSFSFAGKRLSLDDDRGNLSLSFVRLAHAIDARRVRADQRGLTVVWENVPGALSTKDNAFGCILSGFVGCDAPVISPLERGRWPDAGMVAGPLARAAWRVLDAQYFGLAQRRERVFVVVSFRDGPDPARVLFERAGMFRNPPARKGPEQDVAGTLGSNAKGGFRTTDLDQQGAYIVEPPEVAWALQERDAKGSDSNTKDGHLLVEVTMSKDLTAPNDRTRPSADVSPTLRADSRPIMFAADGAQITSKDNRSQPSEEVAPTLNASGQMLCFNSKSDGADAQDDIAPTLRSMNAVDGNMNGGGQLAVMFKPSHYTRGKDGAPNEISPALSADADKGDQDAVVFQTRIARNGRGQPEDVVPALNGSDAGATSDMRPVLAYDAVVRRLTPRECERLQGFEDDYTLVPMGGKMSSASFRFRALGNSMAVPVIAWLGKRIRDELLALEAADAPTV